MRKRSTIKQLEDMVDDVEFPVEFEDTKFALWDSMFRDVIREALPIGARVEYFKPETRLGERPCYGVAYDLGGVCLPAGAGVKWLKDARVEFYVYVDEPLQPQLQAIIDAKTELASWSTNNQLNHARDKMVAESRKGD